MRLKLCYGIISSVSSGDNITSAGEHFSSKYLIWKHGWKFNDTTRHHCTLRWYQARLPSPKCLLIVGGHVREVGQWYKMETIIFWTLLHIFLVVVLRIFNLDAML